MGIIPSVVTCGEGRLASLTLILTVGFFLVFVSPLIPLVGGIHIIELLKGLCLLSRKGLRNVYPYKGYPSQGCNYALRDREGVIGFTDEGTK